MQVSVTDRLIAKTREMRATQREFFRTKDRKALERSKVLEREVDDLFKELDGEARAQQGTLDLGEGS
jgi:hypothetical protein